MVKKTNKQEALSVGRLISEVLVDQLGIPFIAIHRNIITLQQKKTNPDNQQEKLL